MQTILGSGGSIGKFLAKELLNYDNNIRLVSRNPKLINPTDELFKADLTDPEGVMEAVKGSDVVYLTAGIKYKADVWEVEWPLIMANVINACKRHKAKLVFFDNVYAYGLVRGWMKESTPVNPVSRKGEVRRKIADMLLNGIEQGDINGIIAKAADFYGPEAYNTLTYITVFAKLKEGKKPQWIITGKLKHSFTYTPDAAKATALLGNTANAYNRIWHLPTDNNVLTGEEFIQKAAAHFNATGKYQTLPKCMVSLASLFSSDLKENKEMLYQLENEYLFDSSEFESTFFKATPYDVGIKETAGWVKTI